MSSGMGILINQCCQVLQSQKRLAITCFRKGNMTPFMLWLCCEDLAEGSRLYCFATVCPHASPWHMRQCWSLPVMTLHLLHFFSCSCSEALRRRLWAHSPFPWWCCLCSWLALGTTVAGAAPSTPYWHVTCGQENASGGAKRVAFSASKSCCETIAIHSLLQGDAWWWTVVATKVYCSGQEKGRPCFANQRHLTPASSTWLWLLDAVWGWWTLMPWSLWVSAILTLKHGDSWVWPKPVMQSAPGTS